MQSLFKKEDKNAIKERIQKLTPRSVPLWGKMSVAQMLAHLQQPLLVSFGELKLKRGIMGFLFGKMAKKQMLRDKSFKKNMPTVKEFKVAPGDFEKEKETLLTYIDRFIKNGPQIITKAAHPFFGKMELSEWDLLQWKHLDHHLNQFGV